jgi:hypothetical protein
MSSYTNTPQTTKQNRLKANGAMTALHRDPSKAMQQMMEAIDRLRVVYEAETEALKNADTPTFLALQEEKMQSAVFYESGINEIIARKDEMKNVDPQVKRKLNQMQKDFAELSQRNMDALQRMQRTTDRLSGKIRTAAKDAAKKNRVFSYGQNGQIADDAHKHISISLQEDA